MPIYFEGDFDFGHVLLLDCALSLVPRGFSRCTVHFGPGVGVQVVLWRSRSQESGLWSPKFSNPGVGVGVPQKD